MRQSQLAPCGRLWTKFPTSLHLNSLPSKNRTSIRSPSECAVRMKWDAAEWNMQLSIGHYVLAIGKLSWLNSAFCTNVNINSYWELLSAKVLKMQGFPKVLGKGGEGPLGGPSVRTAPGPEGHANASCTPRARTQWKAKHHLLLIGLSHPPDPLHHKDNRIK